jgi:hypothetical protein
MLKELPVVENREKRSNSNATPSVLLSKEAEKEFYKLPSQTQSRKTPKVQARLPAPRPLQVIKQYPFV